MDQKDEPTQYTFKLESVSIGTRKPDYGFVIRIVPQVESRSPAEAQAAMKNLYHYFISECNETKNWNRAGIYPIDWSQGIELKRHTFTIADAKMRVRKIVQELVDTRRISPLDKQLFKDERYR